MGDLVFFDVFPKVLHHGNEGWNLDPWSLRWEHGTQARLHADGHGWGCATALLDPRFVGIDARAHGSRDWGALAPHDAYCTVEQRDRVQRDLSRPEDASVAPIREDDVLCGLEACHNARLLDRDVESMGDRDGNHCLHEHPRVPVIDRADVVRMEPLFAPPGWALLSQTSEEVDHSPVAAEGLGALGVGWAVSSGMIVGMIGSVSYTHLTLPTKA